MKKLGRLKKGDLVVVTVKAERHVYLAMREFADANGISISQAGRDLWEAALQGKVAGMVSKRLKDPGYAAGLRRGLHMVREQLKKISWSD